PGTSNPATDSPIGCPAKAFHTPQGLTAASLPEIELLPQELQKVCLRTRIVVTPYRLAIYILIRHHPFIFRLSFFPLHQRRHLLPPVLQIPLRTEGLTLSYPTFTVWV